jgi:hypothetical protein
LKIIILGKKIPEISEKKNEDHSCAVRREKICAFCEIGYNNNENVDLKLKFMKSLELFEGIKN